MLFPKTPRWLRRGALVVLLGLITWPIASAIAPTEPGASLQRFDGRYAFAGGSVERARVRAAIDGVVEQLNFLMRDLARREMRSNIRPEERVGLDVADAERLRVRLDDWASPLQPVDGTARAVRGPDGARTQFSVRYGEGRITTRSTTPRGTRETWLTLSADGSYLFQQIRVDSDQLPASVRYTLSYRRTR